MENERRRVCLLLKCGDGFIVEIRERAAQRSVQAERAGQTTWDHERNH